MICFIILLSLTFGIAGSLLISASFNDSLSREKEAAVSSHRLLLYTLAAVSNSSSPTKNLEETVSALEQLDAQGGQSWVSLRLSDGKNTLFQSKNSTRFDEELIEKADSDQISMRLTRNSRGAYLLQIAGQFVTGSGTLYLESIYDISPVYAARMAQHDLYQKVFVIVVALGSMISWILSYWLTKPLRYLSGVSRTIASGDLSCRAAVKGKDEISILASDFNHMTDKLEENITELKDLMHRQEEFMGGFAHELKTPMTSIIGYADLLRSHELSERDRREAANYVFTEGRRLEILSLKLLELIVLKRRDFTLVPASVSHIVDEITRLVRPVVKRIGVTIIKKCDEDLCMIEPDLVKSLLLNLMDNARKALDAGGEIFIESCAMPEGCRIRITDNGRGIPKEELSKITDAFYRVDKSRSRAQGGVGLGLALCSEIVSLHNGTMQFESVPGKGTRVTVELRGGAVE
jgi:signal transduction histidine kinase